MNDLDALIVRANMENRYRKLNGKILVAWYDNAEPKWWIAKNEEEAVNYIKESVPKISGVIICRQVETWDGPWEGIE